MKDRKKDTEILVEMARVTNAIISLDKCLNDAEYALSILLDHLDEVTEWIEEKLEIINEKERGED